MYVTRSVMVAAGAIASRPWDGSLLRRQWENPLKPFHKARVMRLCRPGSPELARCVGECSFCSHQVQSHHLHCAASSWSQSKFEFHVTSGSSMNCNCSCLSLS